MIRILTALLLIVWNCLAVADFEMPLTIELGIGDSSGDLMQTELMLEPKIQKRLKNGFRWTISARLRLDSADELEPGRNQFSNYSAASKPLSLGELGMLELREAFLERRIADGRLRIGKQAIVWGKLDGLKVLDALNPQDFREFILDDFESSRIPLWSVYVDKFFGEWRTELALIPDSSAHQLPASDAWFELSAPRFNFGATDSSNQNRVLPDSTKGGVNLGFRLSRRWKLIDLAIVAYDGTDFEPLGVVDNGQISARYTDRQLIGLGAESVFGPVVVRAEVGHHPNRSFNLRSPTGLGAEERDQTRAAIGFDISAPWEVFLNLQYLQDKVHDAPDGLVRPKTDRLVTSYLRRSFAYQTWLLELRWYHSLTDDDDLARASLHFAPDDHWRFGLSIDSFSGRPEGLFGQFADGDRATLKVEYLF